MLLKNYGDPLEPPLGAVEYYLVGKIHRLTSRPDTARQYLARALEIDPFSWLAFEELCRLGANEETVQYLQRMTCAPHPQPGPCFQEWEPEDQDTPRRSARIAALSSSKKGIAASPSGRHQSEMGTPTSSSMHGHRRSVLQQRSSHSSRHQDVGRHAYHYHAPGGPAGSDENAERKEAMGLLTVLGEGYRLLSLYQCKEAIEMFARVPKQHYFTGWVLCQVAKAYTESVDYHSAEKCFEDARRVDPARLEDMDVYSTVLWQLGEDAKLSHLTKEALSLSRLAPQTWCIHGNLHSRQREHDIAIKSFQRAMQLDVDRPYSYTLCGHEYFAQEDFDHAQQCFRKAIFRDGRHYNAWYGCGLVNYRQEKYEDAEIEFRKAIGINNSSSVLKCQLGMTMAKRSNNDSALLQFQQAINADRKNIIAWLEKAKVLQKMEKHQEALEVLKGALVIEHRDPCLHYHIGNAHKKLGNRNEAVMHYSHALDLKPSAADQNFIKTAIEKVNVEDDSQDTEL